GVFLTPYFTTLLVAGLPLCLMALSLGPYWAAGPVAVWKCCPLLRGVGVAVLIVSSLVSLCYNVVIAWAIYYLGSSFQSPLPWSCLAMAVTVTCQGSVSQNVWGSISWASASEVFWNKQVLGVMHSAGLGDPSAVRWPLALCLLAAWVLVFLCMLKGGVYLTATFLYLVILILTIHGATLDGSLNGVRFYLSLDWSRLQSAQVPRGWGGPEGSDPRSQGQQGRGLAVPQPPAPVTLVITIGNCCPSFFAGFAIFSVLGHMAWRKQVPVGSVADSGMGSGRGDSCRPGLAFVAYPAAFSLLPGSFFWSILFFLMLFSLGADTLFRNVEGITTAILDEFPALHDRRRKTALLGALCTSFYLLGLLLVTQGGIFWFTLIDTYSTGFGLIVVSLFMCLGIVFCYGINQFCQHIMDMIHQCPPWHSQTLVYFKVCCVFLTPCLLLLTLIYTFLETYSVLLPYGTYEFPAWGTSLGVCMGVLTCLQVPLWAAVALCRESGTLRD
ncbi:SC6A7 protein, partial [Psophia crepitans]|nr:SC6A7 protein [Psophia crepitans]